MQQEDLYRKAETVNLNLRVLTETNLANLILKNEEKDQPRLKNK